MRIKKGDNVIVIAGKDRGKSGKVLHAFPKQTRVLVEGVGVVKRHQRARRSGQKGQIIDKPTPVHVSNVMLADPKKNVRTRVKIVRLSGKRSRVAVKSGATVA